MEWILDKMRSHCYVCTYEMYVCMKTLESPLHSNKIKSVNLKGNQPSIFIGRTDVEAEAPIIWPHDAKSRLTGKDPEAGKDWRLKEKGAAGDEMVNISNSVDMNLSKLWGIVEDRGDWCATIHGVTKKKQLNNNIIQIHWKCRIKSSLSDYGKLCYQWIKKNYA